MTRRTLSEAEDQVKVCWYGPGGTGKTTNLAHACKFGRVVHLDIESGIKRKPLVDIFDLPVDRIELALEEDEQLTIETLGLRGSVEATKGNGLYWDLREELMVQGNPNGVKAFTADSVTELQKVLNERIQSRAYEKARAKAVNTGKSPTDMERGEFDFYQEDWGVSTDQMRRFIQRFRDLPVHVGFAAAWRKDRAADGSMQIAPALSPAIQTDLIGYVDILVYTEIYEVDGQSYYLGRTHRDGIKEAKDRFGVLPKTMVDPTFDRIVAYVRGDLTMGADTRQQEFMEIVSSKPRARKAA